MGYADIFEAVEKGTVKDVRAFVENNPDAVREENEYGDTPLHRAAERGNLAVAQFLVSAGANVNAPGNFGGTPLHYATTKERLEVAQFLVSAGADVNALECRGYTPLHMAAGRGSLEVVQFLVSAGADVNATANDCYTPLAIAEALLVLTEQGQYEAGNPRVKARLKETVAYLKSVGAE